MAGHIAALDGVRGVAILLVFYHHLMLQSGVTMLEKWGLVREFGLSGVDLFFVLSGFLITGILVENKGQPNYFRNFYARRTLRIFPLYYLVVFVALVVLPRLPIAEMEKIRDPEGAWSYWLYLSNISMAMGAGFRHAVLDVTWSLAIEEQFYLVWPIVVLLLPRRRLLQLCVALIVAGLVLRGALVLGGARWQTTFLLTPCRMDGLVAGSFIAVVYREYGIVPLIRPAKWLGLACAAAFAAVVTQGAEFFQTRIGQWLSPMLLAGIYASLLVFVLRSTAGDSLNRAFTQPLLRTFGKYSYALYLTHVPIFRTLNTLLYERGGGHSEFWNSAVGQIVYCTLAVALSLAAAWLSWHVLEKHFLALKRFFPTRRITSAPAAAHLWSPVPKPSTGFASPPFVLSGNPRVGR